MIRHILKQLWNERRHNIWLSFELVVVALFLLVTVDFMGVLWSNYVEPIGFDVKDTYQLTVNKLRQGAEGYLPEEERGETDDVSIDRLLAAIRLHPDVEVAAVSTMASPFATGGWWTTLRRDNAHLINGQGRTVTRAYFDLFRIHSYDGKQLRLPDEDRTFLVLATPSLVPGGYASAAEALGDSLWWADNNAPVRPQPVDAVCEAVKSQPYVPYGASYFVVPTQAEWNGRIRDMGGERVEMWVRVRPGHAAHFEQAFQDEMGERLRAGQLYVSDIYRVADGVRELVDEKMNGTVVPMLYVLAFVLVTAFLGVFGAFWLRTRQRRGEIGLRMAMGASRGVISLSFLLEALWMMTLAMVPSILVYLNLLYAEVLNTNDLPFTYVRVAVVLSISYLVMAMMVTLGVCPASIRASGLYPSEALRDE